MLPKHNTPHNATEGFTLIELSIVLVIIGLIVGGVLVGRDLIEAAAVRAQIAQIEKYQAAVNTFRAKFNALPGDIPEPDASSWGFAARDPNRAPGYGDGDGLIQSFAGNTATQYCCETAMFWEDLTQAGLIEGKFNTAIYSNSNPGHITGSMIDLYMPKAKIGRGNYVLTSSGGGFPTITRLNYFVVEAVSDLFGTFADTETSVTIPVLAAYNMDVKIDDGLPGSGRVTTQAMHQGYIWLEYKAPGSGNSWPPGPGTCIDNGGVPFGLLLYSITVNGGAGANCALSFQFQ